MSKNITAPSRPSTLAQPATVADAIGRASPRHRVALPEVSVLVSTYEKPSHLRRVLVSLALQEGVRGAMEIVVTDDGSTDETTRVVEQFAREVSFPVHFTTHPHEGFQLARCRNDGVRASRAPYLLFLDGDCVVPRDHVRQHLDHRRDGWVMGGFCCRLDREVSDRITEAAIRDDAYHAWIPPSELRSLAKRHRRATLYNLLGHPGKPKLAGGNIGIWRNDYERVNGYDENFVGWGGEDDDLRHRLAAVGTRVGSILRWTRTYHLWHPPTPTTAASYWQGVNVQYLHRPGRLIRCRYGLVERPLDEITMRIVGRPADPAATERLLNRYVPGFRPRDRAEVEFLFLPGEGHFSGAAECNVLIVTDARAADARALRRGWRSDRFRPHLVLADVPTALAGSDAARWRNARVFDGKSMAGLFAAIA